VVLRSSQTRTREIPRKQEKGSIETKIAVMNPIDTFILVITFKYHVEPFLVLIIAMLVAYGIYRLWSRKNSK